MKSTIGCVCNVCAVCQLRDDCGEGDPATKVKSYLRADADHGTEHLAEGRIPRVARFDCLPEMAEEMEADEEIKMVERGQGVSRSRGL